MRHAATARHVVLIVDDDPAVLRLIKQLLESTLHECRVLSAGNVKEAIGLLERQQVNLLITDKEMPGGGMELARQATAMGASRAILMISGSFTQEDQAEALSAGVGSVVDKPFDGATFVAHVREMLDKARSR